ncbi:hypothetical protein WA588_006278, partial [Blastocystis sp. NMH]
MEIECVHVPWGDEPSFTTQTKLFIGHLLCSTRDPQFPQFLTYHGNHLHYIEVVGVVVREVFREEDYLCTIDDGTGLLDCAIRKKVMRGDSLLSQCIRMVGAIEFAPYSLLSQAREDEGDLCAALLSVVSFEHIFDANEEYIHWMKVIKAESHFFG